MGKIAKGKVKLVEYTGDGAYLQPTINEGEIIPTEELKVKGVGVDGYAWDLYIIDERDDNYEEKRELFLENNGTYGMSVLLDQYGVTSHHDEPEIEELYCEVGGSPYDVVYDTSKSAEENQNSIRQYFSELCWRYEGWTLLELIDKISDFFKYHIMDVVECLGGMDGVNKFWKELVEEHSLNPIDKEDLRREIGLKKLGDEVYYYLSNDGTLNMTVTEDTLTEDELAEVDVNEYIQDIEATIDTYCKEADDILKHLKKSKTPLEAECERLEFDDKLHSLSVSEKVAGMHRSVVQMGDYDVEEGNRPIAQAIQEGTTMADFPAAMAKYFEQESKKGCCLVFSSVMMKYLHDLGVKTWLIGTKEDTGIRASLLYVDSDGKPYVANPVADVEYFTNNGINTPEGRAKCMVADRHDASFRIRGDRHDYSRIPLHTFEEMYGKIFLFGDFYDEKFDGVKFSEVKPKPIDVREVYERLGKYWEYEWLEKRSRTRKARSERKTGLNQGAEENPEDPDNQEL